MFNEIMNGVVDFLNMKNDNYIKKDDTTPAAMYLELRYNIPADSILYVKEIHAGKIPPIVLVWIDYDSSVRISDYIFYKGEFSKIIISNRKSYESNIENKIAIILTIFGDCNNTIIDNYRNYLAEDVSSSNAALLDMLTYTPYIMTISFIARFLPFIEDKKIFDVMSVMFPKIKFESIISAKKLVTDLPIATLLDNGVWYGVSNKEYPAVRFFEMVEDTKTMSWEWDDDDIEKEGDDNNETDNNHEE